MLRNLILAALLCLLNLPSSAQEKIYYGELYSSNPGYRLYRMNMDGSGKELLYTSVLGEVRDIAVDPIGERLYMATYFELSPTSIGYFFSASLDVTDIEELWTYNDCIPAMTIDPATRMLYFSCGNACEWYNLDTKERGTLEPGFNDEIQAMALYKATPLSVELTALQARIDHGGILVTWTTATETGNAGFEVQQKEGERWRLLGFVNGASTTSEPQSYTYRAEGLGAGTHTFRLAQRDHDGAVHYSDEVTARLPMLSAYILEEPYPNPFNAQATVRFGTQTAGQVEVGLYNALGQRVRLLYRGMAEAGEVQEIAMDAEGLPSGSYFVRLEGAGLDATRQVTLLR